LTPQIQEEENARWEAGDKAARASPTPTEAVFASLGKLGVWRPTNEPNKAHVKKIRAAIDRPLLQLHKPQFSGARV
jgi:hypothetical protein